MQGDKQRRSRRHRGLLIGLAVALAVFVPALLVVGMERAGLPTWMVGGLVGGLWGALGASLGARLLRGD